MIAEIGHGLLWLAAACALLLTVAGFAARLNDLAVPAALAVGWLWLWILACLAWLFWNVDLSVAAVAENTQSRLPAGLRLAAVVLRPGGGWPIAAAVVLGVIGGVALVLHALVLAAPPFARLDPAPTEGAGFDPVWRDALAARALAGPRWTMFDAPLAVGQRAGAYRLAAITPVASSDSTGVGAEVHVDDLVLLPEWRETILPRHASAVPDFAWVGIGWWSAQIGPPRSDGRWRVTVERVVPVPLFLGAAALIGGGVLLWRRRTWRR